jgi:ubiquinol-cytochrome c reductase cytochrome c subunit
MKRVLATTCLLLVATSCSYFGREPTPYRPPVTQTADVRDGEVLFMRDCSWCHGNGAQGTERAPSLLEETNGPALTHFMLSTGRMPIDDPRRRSLGGDPLYDDEQILAIIGFLDTFFPPGPEMPELDLEQADLAEGLQLYQNDCASCHATTGIGGALTTSQRGSDDGIDPGIIAPDLFGSTPLQIAEAIRTGPGTMPVFAEGTFDEEELVSLVAYVDSLDEAPDRGGAPLGRVGPVIEGAVGWLVGITLLLAFARWIGTRAGEE